MDSNIIEINNKKVKNEDNEDIFFKNLFNSVKELDPLLGDYDEMAQILGLPDESFKMFAPVFLCELEKALNNSNDKLIMAQAMNLQGVKSDELAEYYRDLISQIDDLDGKIISQVKKDFLKQVLSSIINSIMDSEGATKRINQIPIELCHENAKIPTYARLGDAGADVYAVEDITIEPGETKLIKTGLKVAIPRGYELQLCPRSGLSLKTKMRFGNAFGIIDSGYRGEIGIIIENIEPKIADITYEFNEKGQPIITSILHGKPYHIEKGQRIAQLVLMKFLLQAFMKLKLYLILEKIVVAALGIQI